MKPRILRSIKRKLFNRNSDDWFILSTNKCLGSVHLIQLWHDNTGDTPSWYCNRVFIRDLQTKNEWTFLVYRWFSLTKGDRSIHYRVKEASEEEIMSFKTLLYENCCFDLGEQHDFLGIVLRGEPPPRELRAVHFLTNCHLDLLKGWTTW
ncbi:polycystic kidney disease protein 1-like 3 [Schistocerca nitens]|uniref:polycystic kidney disease protein 1-like 3 n=1 Tax=Schistocerca nitens TaxID=7011 RepID=UPI002118D077|nr:polycystic kidney disease protein 1-like 3 [Schistocerca nitens]